MQTAQHTNTVLTHTTRFTTHHITHDNLLLLLLLNLNVMTTL